MRIVVRGCRVRVRGCRSVDLCAVRYVQGKFLSGINVERERKREGERERGSAGGEVLQVDTWTTVTRKL